MKLQSLKLNQQLSKLRNAVVLSDFQMKTTRGGYGLTGCHPAMCDSGESGGPCTSPGSAGYGGYCRWLGNTCACIVGGNEQYCDHPGLGSPFLFGACWETVPIDEGICRFTGDPRDHCRRL